MTKRRRGPALVGDIKPVTKPLSDKSKLIWQEEWAAVAQAFLGLQQVLVVAEQKVVHRMAEQDGIDITKFQFNVQTMEWQGAKIQPGK